MFKQNPLTALRKVGLALVTFLPYLDALTNPVHDDANTLTDRVILLFLGVVMVAFFVNHITKPISYTIESLKSFSPLIPLVLFAGVYWGSYWNNPSPEGFARCFRFTFLVIPYCFAFLTLMREPKEIEWPLMVLFGSGLILSLICLVFRTHTPFVFLSHGHDVSAMHRGVGRYIAFGTLASITAVIGFIRFCEADRLDIKAIGFLLSVPIALAGAIISGERASLILIAVTLFLYSVHQFSVRETSTRQNQRLYRMASVFVLGAITAVIVLNLGVAEFSRDHWTSGKAISGRFDYRSGMYAVPFYENIKHNPILGVGPANYFTEYGFKTNVSNYPHNAFFEVGGEMGIVGLFAYGLILFAFFRGLFVARNLDRGALHHGIFYCLCAVAFMVWLRTYKQGSIPRSIQFWLYWAYVVWLYEYYAKAGHKEPAAAQPALNASPSGLTNDGPIVVERPEAIAP